MLRKFLCFSSLTIIAALLICTMGATSCTKTNTMIKTDTVDVPQKDTMVTAAILTANSWEAIYDRASVGGNILIYVRGAAGNTMDLDNEYITFNANNTGTYTDNSGNQTSLTWNFTDSTNTTLVWTWNLSTPVTVTWEHLSYHDDSIQYTEYYYMNGVSALSSEIRVPTPL
jgi:hypothetical protein